MRSKIARNVRAVLRCEEAGDRLNETHPGSYARYLTWVRGDQRATLDVVLAMHDRIHHRRWQAWSWLCERLGGVATLRLLERARERAA